MNSFPSPREIQRWYPSKWSDIVGNSEIVRTWKNFIQHGLQNTLFTGPNRTGKTRTISLGIRSLLCTSRTPTLDPCGQCSACKETGEAKSTVAGMFMSLALSDYEFHPIDCEWVTSEDLECLFQDANLHSPSTLLYLDEIAVLKCRRLEGKLLKMIDETQATWVASAISLKKKKGKRKGEWTERLSSEMKGRFGLKVGTSNPHPDDLAEWIQKRSLEWNIHITTPGDTISVLVKRSQQRVGYVLHALAAAAGKEGRALTLDDVIGFNFDTLD